METPTKLAAILLLAGCCNNLPKDISLEPLAGKGLLETEPKTISIKENSDLKGHFIACRAQYMGEEKQMVDDILFKAKLSGRDVVLYFHGGLSSQKYMRDNLGEKLMLTVFKRPEVEERLYPIFMNYDAGVDISSYPKFKENETSDDELVDNFDSLITPATQSLLHDPGFNRLESTFSLVLGDGVNDVNYQQVAAVALNALGGKLSLKNLSLMSYEPTKDDVKYLLKLANAEKIPDEYLNGLPSFFSDVSLATDIERDFKKFAASESDGNIDVAPPRTSNVALSNQIKLRILRILARMALKNDHGRLATIQEEYLDLAFKYIGNGKSLAAGHWDKVKKNSKQCFSDGSNGRAIVDGLLDRNIKINTLSHSAGSIPTAEMIQYLSNKRKSDAIEKVVMVVPAINQRVFNELVVSNREVFKSIDVYALTEKMEMKDTVGPKALYSASLLYGVSALGEKNTMLDKMLLIDQHMRVDRSPYKFDRYLCSVCEDPKVAWSFFNNNDKAKNIAYPFDNGGEIQPGAATHGGTKLPWVSPDLTRRILKGYGIKNIDKLEFENPK